MLNNTLYRSHDDDERPPDTYPDDHRYRELLTTHLYEDHPLHVRRTLDQFNYFSLEAGEMDARDRSQTFSDFFKFRERSREGSPAKPHGEANFPILMVDQLWLWVLDQSEHISTSLTQRVHQHTGCQD